MCVRIVQCGGGEQVEELHRILVCSAVCGGKKYVRESERERWR